VEAVEHSRRPSLAVPAVAELLRARLQIPARVAPRRRQGHRQPERLAAVGAQARAVLPAEPRAEAPVVAVMVVRAARAAEVWAVTRVAVAVALPGSRAVSAAMRVLAWPEVVARSQRAVPQVRAERCQWLVLRGRQDSRRLQGLRGGAGAPVPV
jgi:hypothetical protein